MTLKNKYQPGDQEVIIVNYLNSMGDINRADQYTSIYFLRKVQVVATIILLGHGDECHHV